MSAKIKIAAYPRVSRRKAGGFSTESIGSKPKLDLSFCFSAARRWIVSTYQWYVNPGICLGLDRKSTRLNSSH